MNEHQKTLKEQQSIMMSQVQANQHIHQITKVAHIGMYIKAYNNRREK